MEKYDAVVAYFLADIYLPELPQSTEIDAHALRLECGHEEFWFVKRADEATHPERARCPISWSCRLNGGRTAVHYIEAGAPEPRFAGDGLTRWSVTLACDHQTQVWVMEAHESRLGDFVVCPVCAPDGSDHYVEIVALGARLPNEMVQNWEVELDCGHVGTDYFVPVEFQADPAAYRAQNPRPAGIRCLDKTCDDRTVLSVRRLGALGKIASRPQPPLDQVALAVGDLKRRLTKDERQALILRLQEET